MIQLQILNDIIKTNKKGEQKVIAKNIKSKIWVKPDRILGVSELIRNKKAVYKRRCEVIVEGVGNLIVNSNAEVLLDKLTDKTKTTRGYVR